MRHDERRVKKPDGMRTIPLAEESPPCAARKAAQTSPSFLQKGRGPGRGVPPCGPSPRLLSKLAAVLLVSSFILQPSAWLHAATTIDAVHRYGWGANIGWMDWRGDTNNGAVIGPAFCSGSLYAADVGWISLGSRAPTNGVQYQNLAANDYGVNVDDLGNLRGYAWGANIGWIAFEANGAPAVDFASGRLSGCAWGANVGWISLSNSVAYVQTTPLTPANDLCAGAVALTNGLAFIQSTLTATTPGDLAPGCQTNFGKGVWFTYTPFLNGIVTLSTCGSDFDTVLGVYKGSCDGFTQVACADDNGPSCSGTRASVAFSGTAGVTYRILAGGYSSDSGTLSIVATSPSNDQCAGAVPLADGVPYVMNTTGATATGDSPPACQGNFGKGVWFTYTAPASGDVIASTCGSSFDTVLAVYAGACGALAPVACDDDNGPGCPGYQASVRFSTSAGATYYLLAGGYNSASGTLNLAASLVPVLGVAQSAGQLTVTWSGSGTLQSATNLTQPVTWTDVANGGGFWTEPATNPAKFFRVIK